MNFLRYGLLFLSSLTLVIVEGQDFDHERLSSVGGRVYHEIFVIGSDAEGLTFRHRDGIAKLPFRDLPASYRMLYEPVADLESGPEPVEPAEVAETSEKTPPHPPVEVLTHSRVTVMLPTPVWRLGGCLPPGWTDPCWPSWWPQHQRVHRLTHPLYRELVVRDFLYGSGLLPFPTCR